MEVSLFVPCFINHCYPQVAVGVVRVLRRLGCKVSYNPEQTCCGQPAFNSGDWEDAIPVALHFLDCFGDAETIVAPSGSCVTMVKRFYPELFRDDERREEATAIGDRIFEFSQFVVEQLGVTDVGAELECTVTFHDSCHPLRELGIRQQPRALLREVKGLRLVEMDQSDLCCGFGGTFAAKQPEVSTQMADTKLELARATQADFLVSTESSCLMHLGGRLARTGNGIQPIHLAELLARGLPA